MTITLNGHNRTLEGPLKVTDLLSLVDLVDKPVVVEHNQTALLPREHASTDVADCDIIEIVQITAGG